MVTWPPLALTWLRHHHSYSCHLETHSAAQHFGEDWKSHVKMHTLSRAASRLATGSGSHIQLLGRPPRCYPRPCGAPVGLPVFVHVDLGF